MIKNIFKLFIISILSLSLVQCTTYTVKKDVNKNGELTKTPKWYVKYNREDKKWISHNYNKKKWPRTQDLLNSYILNSAALIAKRSVYKFNRDRLCKNPLPIISRSNSGFDIDDLEDFNYIKKNLKKYGTKFREFSI